MLTAIGISFGVVFLAELPDKSQLITMTYALRYRWWVVLCGAAIAAFLIHGLSVTVGHFAGLTLPQRPMAFVAAIAFLAFAVWIWREGRDGHATLVAAPPTRFVLPALISSYLLAELGDLTMFASVALAAKHNWIGVWIGATVAMVVANGVAIAAAVLLHARLPTALLHKLASVLFLLFGLWLLFEGALGWRTVAVVVTASAAALSLAAAVVARRNATAPEAAD
ncbi:MAG TPA: TMEM165/GDT1 family protein [Mycobacterium sp.]|nr:TMEM165/GDT1 family protein [Mycobacterium sp.]